VIIDFPFFVDKKNIKVLLDEKLNLRYYIRIPIIYSQTVPQKRVLVILKNPSEAKVNHETSQYDCDQTVDRVLRYFHRRNYTDVAIVNLFAKYYPDSVNLNYYVNTPDLIIGKSNDSHIKKLVGSKVFERIVVAWGGYPQKVDAEMKDLYCQRIRIVEKMLTDKKVYYVEKLVNNGLFPKHGMTWTLKAPMKKYHNIMF